MCIPDGWLGPRMPAATVTPQKTVADRSRRARAPLLPEIPGNQGPDCKSGLPLPLLPIQSPLNPHQESSGTRFAVYKIKRLFALLLFNNFAAKSFANGKPILKPIPICSSNHAGCITLSLCACFPGEGAEISSALYVCKVSKL